MKGSSCSGRVPPEGGAVRRGGGGVGRLWSCISIESGQLFIFLVTCEMMGMHLNWNLIQTALTERSHRPMEGNQAASLISILVLFAAFCDVKTQTTHKLSRNIKDSFTSVAAAYFRAALPRPSQAPPSPPHGSETFVACVHAVR